jgi:hypothetical protein
MVHIKYMGVDLISSVSSVEPIVAGRASLEATSRVSTRALKGRWRGVEMWEFGTIWYR